MQGREEVDPLHGLRGLAAFHVMVHHFFGFRFAFLQKVQNIFFYILFFITIILTYVHVHYNDPNHPKFGDGEAAGPLTIQNESEVSFLHCY